MQVLGRSSKKSKIESKILSRYPRSCQDIQDEIHDLSKKFNMTRQNLRSFQDIQDFKKIFLRSWQDIQDVKRWHSVLLYLGYF